MSTISPTRHPLDNRIPPPLVFLLTALAMWAASLLPYHFPIPDLLRYALVTLFTLGGLIAAPPAMVAFRKAKTTINPVHIENASTLITTGIYSRTRNPMYLGLTSLLCAWAVWLNSPWLLPAPLLFALFITRFQILPEERALTTKFGGTYTHYQQTVRRWL